jgi:hypothetical protein
MPNLVRKPSTWRNKGLKKYRSRWKGLKNEEQNLQSVLFNSGDWRDGSIDTVFGLTASQIICSAVYKHISEVRREMRGIKLKLIGTQTAHDNESFRAISSTG